MGHSGTDDGCFWHQNGPLGCISFKLLNRRAGQFGAALGNRRKEILASIGGGRDSQRRIPRLLRLGNQVRSPIFDQGQHGMCLFGHPTAQATEYLLTRKQLFVCHLSEIRSSMM